jgi:hypothetical protein
MLWCCELTFYVAIEIQGIRRVEAHKNRAQRKLHAKTLHRDRENEEHYLNGFKMFEQTLQIKGFRDPEGGR